MELKKKGNIKKQIITLKSDLPIQSGNSVPARDSEYLLPRKREKKNINNIILYMLFNDFTLRKNVQTTKTLYFFVSA